MNNEFEKIINDKITKIEKINIGYSREVYRINDELILKIIKNEKLENDTKKEVDFYNKYHLPFSPKIIKYDFSKTIIPYLYFIEENISGELLMNKWKYLSKNEKEIIIKQILNKLDYIHKIYDLSYPVDDLSAEYDRYLKTVVESNILNEDKIKYLKELKEIIPYLIKDKQKCLIHGDFHFNNVIIDKDNECKIIDFERVKNSYLEREYDPLNRMVRNPNSLINNNTKVVEGRNDFNTIMDSIFEYYKYNNQDDFKNMLLLFDCINSLMWLPKYPDYDLYHDVLFNKSKKLTRI